MNRNTLEFVLNSLYVALVSAGNMTDHQRAMANETLFMCADLPCAPPFAPEILRRIAGNAVSQEAMDFKPPPGTTRRFEVITGGAA